MNKNNTEKTKSNLDKIGKSKVIKKNTKSIYSEKKSLKNKKTKALKTNSPKKINDNNSKNTDLKVKKKTNKVFVFLLTTLILLISCGVFYYIWDTNREFTVSFTDVEGLSFEGYDNLTIKNGKDFVFTILPESGITAYSNLSKVTANGTTIIPVDDIYTINVKNDTNIVVYGYGTSNLTIKSDILVLGTNAEKIVIPYGITEIELGAFNSMEQLQELYIPETVTSIREAAFSDCINLAIINMADSVFDIGNRAFYDTQWLNSQPDGAVYLGKVFYIYKGSMSENYTLDILEGTKGISENACVLQNNLISLNLPNSIISIGTYAFAGCHSLLNINLGSNVQNIGYNIFEATAWDTQQSEGLIYLGNWLYCFKGTLNSSTLTIREGTIGIAGNAFNSLSNLTSVVLPNGLKYISARAFYYSGITEINLPDSMVFIGNEAFKNTNISSINVTSNVEKMGESVFANCYNLTSVQINSNITTLKSLMFENCSELTSVTINGNVSNIFSNIYANCTNLNNFTIYTQIPPTIIGNSFLADASSGINIYVVASALNSYKSESSWSSFGDKIFAIQNNE